MSPLDEQRAYYAGGLAIRTVETNTVFRGRHRLPHRGGMGAGLSAVPWRGGGASAAAQAAPDGEGPDPGCRGYPAVRFSAVGSAPQPAGQTAVVLTRPQYLAGATPGALAGVDYRQ